MTDPENTKGNTCVRYTTLFDHYCRVTPEAATAIVDLNTWKHDLAGHISKIVPENDGRAIALMKLEEMYFWIVSAIQCDQEKAGKLWTAYAKSQAEKG